MHLRRRRALFLMKRLLTFLLAVLGSAYPVCSVHALVAELISADDHGVSLKGASSAPSISGEGRFVVFTSTAKLAPDDTNAQLDVYLRDRLTGKTRRVSDSRGGDQPQISRNGRYVIYRGLEQFPKIRYVDLQGTAPARNISYPFQNDSMRYGDFGSITPDGKFVLFAFRPDSGTVGDGDIGAGFDPRLTVVDASTPLANYNSSSYSITRNLGLNTLGRSVMSRDGNTWFFETFDGVVNGLAPSDTGKNTQDIYLMRRATGDTVLRVSFDARNLDEAALTARNGVHDLALSQDGSQLFYIAERPLTAADTDKGPTIYVATSAGGYGDSRPLLTPGVRPLALSQQAVVQQPAHNRTFLAFSGKSARGAIGHYIMMLTGQLAVQEVKLAAAGTGVPALSVDGGSIVFATPASLSPKDRNGLGDVFLLDNPFQGARTAIPSARVFYINSQSQTQEAAAGEEMLLTEGQPIQLGSGAGNIGDQYFYTQLEIDGVVVARTNNGNVVNFSSYTLPRGRHIARTTTVDYNNVPGQSVDLIVNVRAQAGKIVLRGVSDLQRTGESEGGEGAFTATAYVDNTTSGPTGDLQLVLVEQSNDSTWDLFGTSEDPVSRPEFVVSTVEHAPIVPSQTTPLAVPLSGSTRAPEVLPGSGFHGVGYTVQLVLLEKQSDGSWLLRDRLDLFTRLPRLNDDTPGPNGGLPRANSAISATPFRPSIYQNLTINGPAAIAGGTSAAFSATALYAPGPNRGCTPVWSASGAGVAASISKGGLLTVGPVTGDRTVTVTAQFLGKTATRNLTVKKVSPIISARVTPLSGLVKENGGIGTFRILRTPVTTQAVTVNYAISGTAIPGTDYAALSGTAVIPTSKSFVDLPVIPTDNQAAAGRKDITLTILPSTDYRVGVLRTAKLQIEDDEPVPANQPDLVLRRGAVAVGAKVFNSDTPPIQQLLVNAGARTPIVFSLLFTNYTSQPEDFHVTGTGDFNGFLVRYFQGRVDVTNAVGAGTLTIPNVLPGRSAALALRITPTAETPLQGLIQTRVDVQTINGNFADSVQAIVRRIR